MGHTRTVIPESLDGLMKAPAVDRVLHDLQALHLLDSAEIVRVLPALEQARARLWLLMLTPTVVPPRTSEPVQELLTVKEVADQLRFSPGHVYELVRSGRLRGIRDGRTIRISREALAEWRTAHEADNLDRSLRSRGRYLVDAELRDRAAGSPRRPARESGRRAHLAMRQSR